MIINPTIAYIALGVIAVAGTWLLVKSGDIKSNKEANLFGIELSETASFALIALIVLAVTIL